MAERQGSHFWRLYISSHYKKLNNGRRTFYIDYTVIPILLNWISPTLSYKFQNNLDKTKKTTDGYIYLVQFNEDIEISRHWRKKIIQH